MNRLYPPLIEVVSRDRADMASLRGARIFHTVGLTLWSREELINTIGISPGHVRKIEAILRESGHALRPYSSKKIEVVISQLPVTEASSGELLHLSVVREEAGYTKRDGVRYHPCAVVTLLMANLGCQTVDDLLKVNTGHVHRLLRGLSDNQWLFYVRHNPYARPNAAREVLIPKMVTNYFDRLGRWDLRDKVQVLTRPTSTPEPAR